MGDFQRIETAAELDALAATCCARRSSPSIPRRTASTTTSTRPASCRSRRARRSSSSIRSRSAGPKSSQPLAQLFAAPDIRKIFHAAEYDLYVLKRDCGFRFDGLFDTMISAQLLGYPASGSRRSSSATSTSGCRRTSSARTGRSVRSRDSQLTYAAADVAHLIPLGDRLERELRKLKRLTGPRRSSRRSRAASGRSAASTGSATCASRARATSIRSALSVLRELYLVRDRRAREIDRPPFKVLGNRTLLEIAERRPASESAARRDQGRDRADPAALRSRGARRGGARARRRATARFRRALRAAAPRRAGAWTAAPSGGCSS